MTKLIHLIPALLISVVSFSQQSWVTDNKIYDEAIHTVLLNPTSTQYTAPLISLNSDEKLQLSFDDFNTSSVNYQYTFVLCNSQWKTVSLLANEYIMGMQNESINTYKFSSNTYRKYINYTAQFPNDNIKPKFSGNYILKVFKNYNENDVVITRRFMVVDPKVNISASVMQSGDPEFRFTKQEIDFTVDYNNYDIPNPFNDVHVTIMQNNRFDNAITTLVPKFVSNNKLVYDYSDVNLMDGDNEFRIFDTRSLRFTGQNVEKKVFDTLVHSFLRPEIDRASSQYFQYAEFNGRRVIANRESVSDNDIDYSWVHFSFPRLSQYNAGEMYIFGELTDWQMQDTFKMKYNLKHSAYECVALLKQGYYNYQYVLKNNKGQADQSLTEGNHSETENDYIIYVYHKNQVLDYDELVGVTRLNSQTLKKR